MRTQQEILVSIHAPAKGATCFWYDKITITYCFNPRPREGGDGLGVLYGGKVSCFNPRPREGGDRYSSIH